MAFQKSNKSKGRQMSDYARKDSENQDVDNDDGQNEM